MEFHTKKLSIPVDKEKEILKKSFELAINYIVEHHDPEKCPLNIYECNEDNCHKCLYNHYFQFAVDILDAFEVNK